MVLITTSALADSLSPNQDALPLLDRGRDEVVAPAPNDDTPGDLAEDEAKRFPHPDQSKPSSDLPPIHFATGGGTRVRVMMIAADPRVQLFRLIDRYDVVRWPHGGGELIPWEESVLECTGPCTKFVDSKFDYQVAGEGITPSVKVQFPPGHAVYKLDVTAGSSSSYAVGPILTAAGLCLAAFGGGFLLVGAVDRERPAFVPIAGAVGSGAGLLSMSIGIPLWIAGMTSVRVDAVMSGPKLRLPAGMALRAQGITF